MSLAVCPYCRAPIEDETELMKCPECGEPHHCDCFEENGGCTVFGCSAAPPAEPKLSIGSPDLLRAENAGVSPPASQVMPPPPLVSFTGAPPPPLPEQNLKLAGQLPDTPPMFNSSDMGRSQAIPYPAPQAGFSPAPPPLVFPSSLKNRTTFLLLGILLGAFGAHSFYAGSRKKGLVQLGITVFSFGFAGLMVWIWAVIDICTISTDNKGIPFRS